MIGVEFQLSNSGDDDVIDAEYEVLLTTNTVIGGSDDIIVYESNVSINRGGQKTVSLSSDIENYLNNHGVQIPAGTYYVALRLDPRNYVEELSETNNNGVSDSSAYIAGDDGDPGDGNVTEEAYPGWVTISTLSTVSAVAGASVPGSAPSLNFDVQYDDGFNGASELFYGYSVTPGIQYELFADDSYVGSGNYTEDIDLTLFYYNSVTSQYERNGGDPLSGYDFDSPYPGGTYADSGIFIAAPSFEQVVRIRPYSGGTSSGTYAFGMIESSGQQYSYPTTQSPSQPGSGDGSEQYPWTTYENSVYVGYGDGQSLHYYDVTDATSYGYLRYWSDDAYVGSGTYSADIQAVFQYQTTSGGAWSTIGGLASGSTSGLYGNSADSPYDLPAVLAIPPGAISVRIVISEYNAGAVPTDQNYAFTYDLYNSGSSGESY